VGRAGPRRKNWGLGPCGSAPFPPAMRGNFYRVYENSFTLSCLLQTSGLVFSWLLRGKYGRFCGIM